MTGAAGAAQSLPGLSLPAPSGSPLPAGVRQEGTFLTAPIRLDGVPLFRIAVSATPGGDQMSVETRVEFIEAALAELVVLRGSEPNSGTVYDPETFKVKVEPNGPQAILSAVDAKHTTPFPILTVTTTDGKYQGLPVSTLAEQWQATLQTAIVQALEKRQPAVLARNFGNLWKIGLAFGLLTIAVVAIVIALRKRSAALAEQVEADERAIDQAQSQSEREEVANAQRRRRFLGLAVRAVDPVMSLSILRATRGVLIWGLVLLWFGGLVWALSLFPETTPLGETIFHRATRIAFTWIAAALLIRIVAIVVGHITRAYADHAKRLRTDEGARQLLRAPTIANTIVGITQFVVYFFAILASLSLLGISTASVLTLGGLVALAISLAAQNLVRDFLNGFLVLVEDQYVVGDHITVGNWSGLVEHMSLRVVQLRDNAGNLVTIPHSAATEVVNSSRLWSRVDFRIAVDAAADQNRAVEILRRTVGDLAADPKWRATVVEPVEWVGIDAVSTAGIVLRASIKTAPLRQFEIRRELNARMVGALRDAGIALGGKDAYLV
jgi:small-conductance mechanosensitive channel